MKNPLLKFIIILLHSIILGLQAYFYWLGYQNDNTLFSSTSILIFGLLGIILYLFCLDYYLLLSENIAQNLPFLPLFIEVSQIAVLLTACSEPKLYTFYPASPYVLISIIVFCGVLLNLMITGYGIFSHNKSLEQIRLFLAGSILTAITIAVLIPKTQNLETIRNSFTVLCVESICTAVNLVVFIGLIITDPPGNQTVKNVTGLVLSLFTWFFLCIRTEKAEIIAIVLLFISMIVITIIVRKKSIRL